MHGTVEIKNRKIYIDGIERQIVSGAIHYFRSLPEKWDRLLEKAKGFGLDAVETYVAWDQHEPREGVYDFSGGKDLLRFIDLAAQHGLLVIVRPGPYICAEWTNGGLPPWLTTRPDCRIRRDDPVYMAAVERWFRKLLPMLAEKQYTRGGPVILSVVENEYGSYGSDKVYLEKLRALHLEAGFDVPLFTADGGGDQNYAYGGSLAGCPAALTMGPDNCMKAFELHSTVSPDDPLVCMEFWCGAYDHWEQEHRTLDRAAVLRQFETMLENGISVNLYMFHGGTNFGFFNGANTTYSGEDANILRYWATATSYDYNAPLDESGETTPLFWEMHEIMRKYRPDLPLFRDTPRCKIVPPQTAFSGCAPLFEHLDEIASARRESRFLIPMREMDQYYGFQLCRCTIPGPFGDVFNATICAHRLGDRAQIFFDGKFVCDLTRNKPGELKKIHLAKSSAQLTVLAENQGYVNFDAFCGEKEKGAGEIRLGGGCNHFLTDWEIYALPMDDLSHLVFGPPKSLDYGTPAFYRAEVEMEEPRDTFLEFPGVKGFVLVNGFNIGRYWNVGPGNTLYVPGELLKKGRNEFIVFEQYEIAPALTFCDSRTWDIRQKEE
ncbi:MAG: beta-galactosidase [Lentisphaeria bacterium]|nr:beta-galactosidase [Lentisphaeria bacterium]